MSRIHEFVTPQRSGVISSLLRVSQRTTRYWARPKVQIEFTETSDGFSVRAVVPVPAEQQWFWSDRWRGNGTRSRRRALVQAYRVRGADSAEAFLDHFTAK